MSQWVVEVLRWGFQIQFHTRPRLSPVPIIDSGNTPYHKHIIQAEIASMLEKQAIEEVFPPYGPGFYSRLFVVPKPNGKWRPIIDLKALNDLILIPKFQMESIQSIWAALIPGNFTFSLDMAMPISTCR